VLRDGVKKHGLGAWEKIRSDPEFSILRCGPTQHTTIVYTTQKHRTHP
jgi:hypothetical protein